MSGMGDLKDGWGAARRVPSRWGVVPPEPPEPPVYVPEARRRRIAKAEERARVAAGDYARSEGGPEAERLLQRAHDQLSAASSFAGVLRRRAERRAEAGDPPLASEVPMINLTDEWLRRARSLVAGLQRRRDVGLSPDEVRHGLREVAALERLNPDARPPAPEPAAANQPVPRMSVRSVSSGPVQVPREDLVRMEGGRFEYRADSDGDGGTLVGYAAVFNQWTEIDSWEGKFRERIAPGAFRKTLNERREQIKVLFNHGMDPQIGNKPLGKPTVMREDSKGMYVEVPLDDTTYNRDIKASLASGALDGMSFRMSVTDEEWAYPEDGDPERTIRAVKLYEFGPVTFPAYEATQAGVRAHAPAAFEAWRAAGGHPASQPSDVDDGGRRQRRAEWRRIQRDYAIGQQTRAAMGHFIEEEQ